MTGIQCKDGHIFSMIIDSENKSPEWVLESSYYVAQGCNIVIEDDLRFSNSKECSHCLNLEHKFEELIDQIVDDRN